jgi:hypothetical protein
MIRQTRRIIDDLIRLGSQTFTRPFRVENHPLQPARTLDRQPPPMNIGELPDYMRQWFEEEASLPDQVLHEFTQVRVSWHGIVLRDLQLFVPSLAYPTYEREFSGAFLLRQWISKGIAITGTVGLIYDHWAAGNYYHWLIDSLPRLLLLREKYPECVLIVPEPSRSYIQLTTAALGFHILQPIATESFALVQQLIMPSHVAPPGKQDPNLIRRVRSELAKELGYSSSAIAPISGKWLYVSRSKQQARRLANEHELVELFKQYAIETIYFEDMSFEQQVSAMQNVEVFIGMHGANLTNMLFLAKGAKVIELFNQTICNLCYFHLASNLELLYYAVPCLPLEDSGVTHISNSADITVDISFLTSVLATL